LAWAVHLYHIRPRVIRLDAAYWGLRLIAWIHGVLGAVAVIPWNPKRQKNRSCLPPTWTKEELGKRSSIERFCGRVFLFFRLQRPPSFWMVHHGSAGRSSLHRHHHRRFGCPTGWSSRSHPFSKAGFSSYVGGLLSEDIPAEQGETLDKCSPCVYIITNGK
jgi:hypothetical protein